MTDHNKSFQTEDVVTKVLCINSEDFIFLKRIGVIPAPTKGNYHLINCVQGYIRYLQKKAFENEQQEKNAQLRNKLLERKLENIRVADGE